MGKNLPPDAIAAAWVRFAASAFAAYGVPREYPAQALDTHNAAKRAALAADELLAEFLDRDFTTRWIG